MGNPSTLVKSGFKKLDDITGGFFPTEVCLIGSKPAAGKTAFLLDIIKNICVSKAGKPVMFSLEMSELHIKKCLVSKVSGIDLKNIRSNTINDETALLNAEKKCTIFN